jgi:hypothetical protein
MLQDGRGFNEIVQIGARCDNSVYECGYKKTRRGSFKYFGDRIYRDGKISLVSDRKLIGWTPVSAFGNCSHAAVGHQPCVTPADVPEPNM